MWTYQQSDQHRQFNQWDVGYYTPVVVLQQTTWTWKAVEHYPTLEEARGAVHFLNGGSADV